MNTPFSKSHIQLPKDALQRIHIGHSFAEYDIIRDSPALFEQTPSTAAFNNGAKCFFVGRRGTGKTALTYFIKTAVRNAIDIHPQVMSPLGLSLHAEDFTGSKHQRPFKTLVACFKRALLAEILLTWLARGLIKDAQLPKQVLKEINTEDRKDFDLRLLEHFNTAINALNEKDEDTWLREIKRGKTLEKELGNISTDSMAVTILIDRIDESWDGSTEAVIFLMALMHACVELRSSARYAKPLLFLRENLFDRVRNIDTEFARLETWKVSLEWSEPLLVEMIERRLNHPFTTKLPLGGETWDYFFEPIDGKSSRGFIFEFCQERPRDILTFCEFAIQAARSAKHQKITVEDVQSARRRFSESRLKDLGDEYAENYPHIELVLQSFFGLGVEYTLHGLVAFIQKAIVDPLIIQSCGNWIFSYAAPEKFAELLWNIGFLGIGDSDGVHFRAPGSDSSRPTISGNSRFVIHGTFCIALCLHETVIGGIDETFALRQGGVVSELPEAFVDLSRYNEQLGNVIERLKTLPLGAGKQAEEFEDIVGDIVKLCFFRWLANLDPKSRNQSGRVIRDWICSNIAADGFWEAMRHRYNATNVIWECKNYAVLSADDFHQANYYLTQPIGGFSVLVFRGEKRNSYFEHIGRIASLRDGKGVVVLVNEKDLMVFVRQSLAGKSRDSHIRAIYDDTIKKIS